MSSPASLPVYDDDPAHLRRIFSYFPSGVVLLAAEVDGTVEGLVASSFTAGVSLDPPLVLCAIQRTSRTWPRLRGAETLGVSVLGEDHGPVGRQVASRRPDGRFTDVPLRTTGGASRFLQGAPVWLDCTVYAEHEAGDHTVVVLRVSALGADPTLKPLIFHASDFRRLSAVDTHHSTGDHS